MENKSLTKDFDKSTDELADMKQALNTICRKGLEQFEGPYSVSKIWFKLDVDFFKTTFSKSHSEFYKALFKNKIENQDMEVYKTFIVPFDK